MKTALKLTMLFLLLFAVSCSEDDNPVDTPAPEVAYNKLSITTKSPIYTWQQDESHDYITVQGTVINESETIFYSSLGEFMLLGEQDKLFIAGNSHGSFEKYNESNDSWEESDLGGMLIEGSRVVPVKPSKDYTMDGFLSKNSDDIVTGTYRIRIDYYDVENPDSDATPFYDYSNSFTLQ